MSSEAEIIASFIKHLNFAIENGETFRFFNEEIKPDLMKFDIDVEQYDDKRLQLIYNTFNSFYYVTRRYAAYLETADIYPYFQYQTILEIDNECSGLEHKVFASNDKFWDKFLPPNHPNCPAYITALDEEDLKLMCLEVTDGSNLEHPHPEWAFNCYKDGWKNFFNNFIVKTIGIYKQ